MQTMVKVRIKTMSNLFIGGASIPFEIGGIDQQTVIDQDGYPYIPGSSLKGAVRAIVHEDHSEREKEISRLYAEYLNKNKNENWELIQKRVQEKAELEKIEQRYDNAQNGKSAEYLFGISAFNNTPRLLFSDLFLCDRPQDNQCCFSIDRKNSIDTRGNEPVSNPRSYRAARSGLVFEGEIQLYRLELLDLNANEHAHELCRQYLIDNLMKFNEGIYRLGNSKSRGYGKVEVSVVKESGALRK